MSDNSESFRNELVSKLFNQISQDQLIGVLKAFDSTLTGYDISKKPLDMIPVSGIPEIVKYFIASKAVESLSKGTLYIYKLRLEDFFSRVQKPFQDIRSNDIRLYLFYYKDQRHASDAYRDGIRRTLNSFFQWCVNNEYLLRNPCSTVEKIKYRQKERKPFTQYELEILRWNCKTLREKAMVDFLYSTGVRVSEFSAINKQDIDWIKRSVVIHHGKGDKGRTVFFNAEAEVSLKKYLESRSDDNEALFVTIRNPHNRLGKRSVEFEIKNIASRTDFHAFPHKLRHTFATSGLNGGMSLEDLQALMGHAKPETTLIYAKIDTSRLQMEHSRVYA